MTKVIDRLARREGGGFMTALGRQPRAGRLCELLSAYSDVQGFRSHDGWPTQAWFWLEWGCSGVTDDDPADKLDCLHALGVDTFSPEWSKSFRHILLLPSPNLGHPAPIWSARCRR